MTKSDFGSSMVDALKTATLDGANSQAFVKAALALRAWYRHMTLALKPELVVHSDAQGIEVYGDVRIEKTDQGELQLVCAGNPVHLGTVEAARLGRWLATSARARIRVHYYAMAQDYLKGLGLENVLEKALLERLSAVDSYVHEKLNVPWWRQKCTLADDERVLGKVLWDSGIIDREVFGLGVRINGFRFSMKLYNQCATSFEALTARVKEAPNMVPWLLNREVNELMTHQTVWRDLKNGFIAQGGTSQGWKWLCAQGQTWFRHLDMRPPVVELVNRLAALQLGRVPYHHGLMGRLVYRQDPRLLDVFKAAMVAYRKRKLKVSEFQDYNLIFDYLHRVKTATTKGATWASLLRKQREWHLEEARRELARRKEQGGCLGWAPIVQSLSIKRIEAKSLNTSDELWEEGTTMQHCVGGYDQACYRNQSRIYSMTEAGHRVATLEIRLVDKTWTIGQLYGPGNSKVKDKDVIALSKKVLSACKRAPKLDMNDNKVLRRPMLKHVQVTAPAQEQSQPVWADDDNLMEIPF